MTSQEQLPPEVQEWFQELNSDLPGREYTVSFITEAAKSGIYLEQQAGIAGVLPGVPAIINELCDSALREKDQKVKLEIVKGLGDIQNSLAKTLQMESSYRRISDCFILIMNNENNPKIINELLKIQKRVERTLGLRPWWKFW